MLIEILENRPIANPPSSLNDIHLVIANDIRNIILNSCHIDLSNPQLAIDLKQSVEIIAVFKNIYYKVYHLKTSPEGLRSIILYSLMGNLFKIWTISTDQVQFFILLKQSFSAAHLVANFMACFTEDKIEWLMQFFTKNKELLSISKRQIKTIALYYPRYFSGGVEKFLSLIIPIYLKMNYKVIFFTDVMNHAAEYSLPTPPPPVYI